MTEYDYWITPSESGDPIGFNKLISADTPEERATAQFRKEQFDSQSTVGDQSLTGWWTRGQLSFHKGGGVLFYEVLEGETVIDRYNSGIDVNPFIPGRVSMSRAFDINPTSTFGFVDCVYVQDYTNGDRIVGRGDDGNVYRVTVDPPFSSAAITQITTTGTDDVVSIASSRFRVYMAVGENIEVWYPGMGSTSTVLWTGSLGGNDITNIWYAKQRLWVVDSLGNWYVLDTVGGTFDTATDAKFKIKDYGWLVTTTQTWSLVESPGPVYIGAFNEVYAVTVTYESGSLLPTIEAPTLVAQLPGNETIYCMGYAVGTLMLGTGHGARFAVQNGEGLAYGPAVGGPAEDLYPSFGLSRRVAAIGSRLCTGGYFFDESGVYSFDLNQMTDTLQPAYTLEVSTSSDSGYTGALNTPGGLVTWNSTTKAIYRQSATKYAATASLKTGFHRFGTLDPKWFRSALVRIGGDGGSVEVFRIDPDGTGYTYTSLGTITYPETEADLDLGPDVPAERVGLRFVLNRDPLDETKGPILHGYQLKALPVPKRQRMVRIPLQLFDFEADGRTRQKRGAKGQAWTRLQALEALEESNAVVQFEDTETGETGLAYIEAVEVRRTAPVSTQGDGFGGVLTLTLRKL